ncbi:MAG: DUF456 domain-containing protein, partial [Gemmatimonadales bacterium]
MSKVDIGESTRSRYRRGVQTITLNDTDQEADGAEESCSAEAREAARKPPGRVRKNMDMDPVKLAAVKEIFGVCTETGAADVAGSRLSPAISPTSSRSLRTGAPAIAMDDPLALLLLAGSGIGGLLLIPFGLPGLWVILLGILGYGWLTDFRTLSVGLLALAIGLALVGEVVEAWLGFRLARRYGGSRRAGWGALLGGLVGAVVGVPLPLVGSVVGAFVGAFAGAALFEYTQARHSGAAA